MAEPFKNMFNEQFLERFSSRLKLVIPDFDQKTFISRVIDDEWENRELLQRCRHISTVLKDFLPPDYKSAIVKILELLDHEKEAHDYSAVDDSKFGLALEYGWILSDFIQVNGTQDIKTSIKAIETLTQFTSCEFAVRPLIKEYPDEMMKQMLLWSKHKHWAVRRLSSEGCRPRLPWAMALPDLKENPAPIIPILENLKNDEAKFVRLSVANNLNDIAKDNPGTVIDLAKIWLGETENTDWVIKHGCRTLLKQGNAEAMELFGFGAGSENIIIEDFKISSPKVEVGESLEFSFKLLNNNTKKTKIRLEYGVYYQKANGSLSKKVHKISEKEYAENSSTPITKKHSFQVVTTRVLHPGLHQVSVIINGNESEKLDFELIG